MTELLAPAGSMESLIAAISNGADAIYLGLNKFGARAYANNFNYDELKKALDYAHLRAVKIYVTMNTIIFDEELSEAYQQINRLYELGVDGVIIQDLALLAYIIKCCPEMEAHCSTQLGIDDLEGTLLFKSLGAKRVVLSREVSIDQIKKIKAEAKLPIEIFVHGALCVSYSGNCLMSGLIGYRSGNRGRCVGSCRKPYDLINQSTGEVIAKNDYILSMKDLNTIDYINEIKIADSLKIEGRMKEPAYVANVVAAYRSALDGIKADYDLSKTFNRTFTKGYIFNEDKKYITNILKPNNFGYKIGYISKKTKLGYEIKLTDTLNQNDIIRIDHNGVDVNLSLAKMYDKNDNLISFANSYCYIKIKEELAINDIVYKTKDIKYNDMLSTTYPKEYKRFALDIYAYGEAGTTLSIAAKVDELEIYFESDFILDKAIKSPTTQETFSKQFNRLNDTVYYLNECGFYVEDVYIPAKLINELRRQIILKINEKRLAVDNKVLEDTNNYPPLNITLDPLSISVYCNTLEQYNAAKDLGIKIIYYKDNIIRRNKNTYKNKSGHLLIGGYGGIYKYKNTNDFSTDFSFNVVNHKSAYLLHSLGAKRICLSHEMNLAQINNLSKNYYDCYKEYPNLELIVYGRADMMFTNYCPLKVYNQCGNCKENQYILKEEYGEFPIISHEDCTTTIVNGKALNLIDNLEEIKGINTFRLNFTIESYQETSKVIKMFLNKLKSMEKTNCFNKETNTRGHFNKEIL